MAAHHLDDDHAIVRLRRRVQAIDRVGRDLHRGLEAAREVGAVEVVVDRFSLPYLAGATIDFVDRIDAQGFTIDNPNATGSCACGDSFH